ncbi:MAG: OmpH family outer membrane protein [Nannocystaceae bacterium]|nr:OmpH family outer membrane protein [Nannocystaceae bacterium]
MKLVPLVLVASVALGTVLAPLRAAQAAGDVETLERLALLDLQRCLTETKEGKRAKKKLEGTYAKGQARIEKKTKDLQRRFRDLQAKSSMLAEAELIRRQQELMLAEQEVQQMSRELEQDVTEKEAVLTDTIYKKLEEIVAQVSLEENLQVVLVRSQLNILYFNPQLDITNRVIVRYDKKHK